MTNDEYLGSQLDKWVKFHDSNWGNKRVKTLEMMEIRILRVIGKSIIQGSITNVHIGWRLRIAETYDTFRNDLDISLFMLGVPGYTNINSICLFHIGSCRLLHLDFRTKYNII